MSACCHVDDHEFVRDLLLGECDEDATRKSRERIVVQLETEITPVMTKLIENRIEITWTATVWRGVCYVVERHVQVGTREAVTMNVA